MATTKYEVGPRKVTEVYKEGNTTTRTDFKIEEVTNGDESDFISAFRVYEFTEYTVKEEDADTLEVDWEMGNGESYTIRYTN